MFEDYQLLAESGLFDARYYLGTNPDIAASNIDPLLHYIERGAREGRSPRPDFDVTYYLEQCRSRGEEPANPLVHFVTIGASQGIKTQAGDALSIEPTPLTGTTRQDPLILGIDGASVETMSDDSTQFTMRGWAIAEVAVVEISLSYGDAVLGYAAYGFARPDVAAIHPNYPKADHSGYSLTVESLPDGMPTLVALSLEIVLANGAKHLRPFLFNLQTSEVTRATSDGERIRPAAAQRNWTPPPLRLEVDEVRVDARGVLDASGWAVCFLDIDAIRIFVNDLCLGIADFGRIRDDVAAACPEYPQSRHSGFHFRAPVGHLGPGRNAVKVQALTQSGTTREAIFPITIPDIGASPLDPSGFHFHCDEISLSTRGRISVTGWAVCGAPTESISVRVDDTEIGLARLGMDRPDVGNIFHQHPHARQSGFAFHRLVDLQLAPGEHVLTLTLKDKAGSVREMPLPIHAVELDSESTAAVSAVESEGDRAMFIDLPVIVKGAAETSITGNLSISGWALARHGVKVVSIAVGGKHIVDAHYGIRRTDVASQYPDRSDATMSGFAALIPNWSLPKGQHTMSITLIDMENQSESIEFKIQVDNPPEGEGPWSIRQKISQAEISLQTRILVSLKWRPRFHLLIKAPNNQDGMQKARLTLASLREQAYENWSALIVSHRDAFPAALRKTLLVGFEDISKKVQIFSGMSPMSLTTAAKGIAYARTVDPLFLTLIAAGDVLGRDAMLELALATGVDRNADFLYSDERRTSPVTKVLEAYFKPAWSPDLLLSTNYIGRLWVVQADLVERTGITVSDWLDHGDYDVVLRITEKAKFIEHVPKVLCERGTGDVDSADLERKALARALTRGATRATVMKGCATGIYRVKRKRKTRGLVSIIIPTCAAGGLIKNCLESLRGKTAYRNFEVICIENIPAEKHDWKRWLRENVDDVIETSEPFNWSRYNNLCVARSSGEFLLFLNDDIEVLETSWLDTLLQQAERPEVGAVGPQLLYGDRSVQHAGLALTTIGKARHMFRHAQPDDPGYFGLALTERNVIGVTGACLLTRRDVFEAVGRFNEAHTIVNNDLDYCLRTWRNGYLNIYTPHAQLIHHELASRGELGDDYDSSGFVGEWRDVFLKGDPYLNPNLSREFDDLSPEREPIRVVCAGHPLFAREAVQRILVVKLDHIGDCLTALPAIRRLKDYFPKAQLSVLANRATKSIWAMESAIDKTFEFDFFHARSGLGKKELAEQDLLELRQRLEPFRFDLAVDLRKSPDTRNILQFTGARLCAGYDFHGEYPWLDVSLEWEGDTRFRRKRQHVADDLLNLVEAIFTSCRSERSVLRPDPNVKLTLPDAEKNPIFSKPVVCIHPAAGTEMRQWPPQYFAELIDLIVEHHDVHAVIVGGPNEIDIAGKVIDGVRNRHAVYCLVGKLKLAELPTLISLCTLFVGNNSGPKHIAAALGVPTVGVHSGVIDSNEWGPLGESAVAIRRDMACSPCYLEKSNDCPKDLACLKGLGPGAVYRVASRMLAIRMSFGEIGSARSQARPKPSGPDLDSQHR